MQLQHFKKYIIGIFLFIVLLYQFPHHVDARGRNDEGLAPRINFKIEVTKNGATVPMPGVYIESFTLTNQPVDPASDAVNKGNVIWIRYRKTGTDGKTAFETGSPAGVNNTPIDIDLDGKTDTFNFPFYPNAYTGKSNKSMALNINGVPVTEDPKYCLSNDLNRLTRLSADPRGGECSSEAGPVDMNFLCGNSPFYARVVTPASMKGKWVFKAVSKSDGDQKPLSRCTGEYSSDFGESNNYSACIMEDPMKRGFDVVRWGHGNTVADLTFFIEFTEEKPEPTAKPIVSEAASLAEEEWTNFRCLEAQMCSEDSAQCKEKTLTKEVKRVKIRNIIGTLNVLRDVVNVSEPMYLVECVSSNSSDRTKKSSYACTTGNTSIDSQLGLTSSAASASAGFKVSLFSADGGTISDLNLRSPANKTLDEVEWQSPRMENTSSVFMIAFKKGQVKLQEVGSAGGQQFATLTSNTGCTLIKDPYGRVFDTHTLEPLKDTKVTLQKKLQNGSYKTVTSEDISAIAGIKTILNPQMTKDDGFFSFFVPNGTYKLVAERKGYSMQKTQTSVNEAATQMYANIYDGGDIVQKDEMIHTDIPLQPANKKVSEDYARDNPVTLTNYVQSLDKETNMYHISGYTSHPLSTVHLYSQVPNDVSNAMLKKHRKVASVQTDMWGRFEMHIDMRNLKKHEVIGELELVKYQVSFNRGFSGSVEHFFSTLLEKTGISAPVQAGASSSVSVAPILPAVSGFAYSATGKVLPNTQVEVMTPYATNPVYSTTSDANGFFEIPDGSVPPVEYWLRYGSNTARTEVVATNRFFAQNTESVDTRLARADASNGYVLGESTENKEYVTSLIIATAVIALAVSLFLLFRPAGKKKHSH